MTLLIIDDEELTRTGIVETMNWPELGIGTVLQADDGVRGLEMARLHRPDIMLCDIRMPRMDGIEMLSQIESFLPDTIVIFMSGYSDKEYLKTLPLFIDGRKTMNYSDEQIYIDVMQKVFLQYINVSDFVKDSGYTEEDLTPPHIGKSGDLDMSMITNDTVYAACKYSKRIQALLKLLIHTFYRIKSYTFYSFNEFETKKISDFLMLFS